MPLHRHLEEVSKAKVSYRLLGPSGGHFSRWRERCPVVSSPRCADLRLFSLVPAEPLLARVLRAGVWPCQTSFSSFYLGISLTGPWIRFPWILWWRLRALCTSPGSTDTVVLSPGLRFGAGRTFLGSGCWATPLLPHIKPVFRLAPHPSRTGLITRWVAQASGQFLVGLEM